MTSYEDARWTVSVTFRVTGFEGTPEDITRAMETTPTTTVPVGGTVLPSGRRLKGPNWAIKTGRLVDAEPAEVVRGILLLLPRTLDKLLTVTAHWDAALLCGITMRREFPPLFFDREILARVATLGCGLDVDLIIHRPSQ